MPESALWLSSAPVRLCPSTKSSKHFSRAGRARHQPKQSLPLRQWEHTSLPAKAHRDQVPRQARSSISKSSPRGGAEKGTRAEARSSPCKLLNSAAPRPSVLSPSVSSKLWPRHHEPRAPFFAIPLIDNQSASHFGSSEGDKLRNLWSLHQQSPQSASSLASSAPLPVQTSARQRIDCQLWPLVALHRSPSRQQLRGVSDSIFSCFTIKGEVCDRNKYSYHLSYHRFRLGQFKGGTGAETEQGPGQGEEKREDKGTKGKGKKKKKGTQAHTPP